jgi:hypothetical protein
MDDELKEVENLVEGLIVKSMKYHNETNDKFTITDNNQLGGPFMMIQIISVITAEILTFYHLIMTKKINLPFIRLSTETLTPDRIKEDMVKKAMIASESYYIQVMSTIEYGAKELLKQRSRHPVAIGVNKLNKKHIHLWYIIKTSSDNNIMRPDIFQKWDLLIKIRNMIVHNNGIADFDAEYDIGELHIVFQKGKQPEGPINSFAILSSMAMDYFKEWILAMTNGKND